MASGSTPHGGQNHLPGQMPEPTELLTFLKQRYMLAPIPVAGQAAEPSHWDRMKAALGNDPQRISDAAAAIKHFIECGQAFLAQHQPTTMHYMAQGMGLELAGGFIVSTVAPQYLDQQHVGVEPAGDIPISVPRSQIGQHGIVPSTAVPVTGNRPEPYQPPGGSAPQPAPPASPPPPPAVDPHDPLSD